MSETERLLAKKAKLAAKIKEARERERKRTRRDQKRTVRIMGEALAALAERSDDERVFVLNLIEPLVADAKDRVFLGLPVAEEGAYEPVSTATLPADDGAE